MPNDSKKFDIVFLHEAINVENDNIDVVVRMPGGETRTVTFFTVANIVSIMNRYKSTGECLSGRFFWASDLVIAEDLKRETIESIVVEMIKSGEYAKAFGLGDGED